jgi:predicted RNA-binding Zn-ribbon protein involved in translation (DUF1610 family)
MHIPIHIPVGTKHVAAVRGTFWKLVSCEHCGQQYAYRLELEAVGEELDLLFLNEKEASEQARANAEQNLVQKSRNVVLTVPCPNCGFYQEDMSRRLKEDISLNSLQIVGVAIAVLSLIPLAFKMPYIWVLTILLAMTGVILLVYGYVVAFRYDPNAGDPEPRKAIGRKLAVWGDKLAELPTINSLTASDTTSDRMHPIDA